MSLQIKRRLLTLPQTHVSASSKWIAYLSLFSVLVSIGILFHNEIIGQIIVVLLGFGAILCGLKGEEFFKLMLVAFGITIASTLLQVEEIARHFATYGFLLLCLGGIRMVKEQLHSYSDV